MEQLSRICNVYLLIIAIFQSIKSISYTDGYPLVLISLTALIVLNGFKDYIEDSKRKSSDKKENNNRILIYNQKTKEFIEDVWQNIKLVDIIKVEQGQKFPCDLIFIESSPESKGQCKVDTKNINGETNLNTKKINPKFNFQDLSFINHLCITKKPNEHIYDLKNLLIDGRTASVFTYSELDTNIPNEKMLNEARPAEIIDPSANRNPLVIKSFMLLK